MPRKTKSIDWSSKSPEERIKELQRLMTTPEDQLRPSEFKTFYDLHKRICELVGRDVYTHEFAFPELLYEEIRSGKTGSAFGKSLIEAAKLTKEKKGTIIVPVVEDGIPLGFKVVGKIDLSKEKKKEESR